MGFVTTGCDLATWLKPCMASVLTPCPEGSKGDPGGGGEAPKGHGLQKLFGILCREDVSLPPHLSRF